MSQPGRLTVHVLDTSTGRPAAAMHGRLFRLSAPAQRICDFVTNDQGRCADPLLQERAFMPGRYRLEFDVAAYFRGRGVELSDPPFLDVVTIDFGIADETAHYHVPLLVSPFSYTTYRGS